MLLTPPYWIYKFNQSETSETLYETYPTLFILNSRLKVNNLQRECAEEWYLYKQNSNPY